VLANRGRAFVELEEHFSDSHSVLMIHAKDRDAIRWNGAELAIPREILGGTNPQRTWLEDGRVPAVTWADGALGPCLVLDIPCRGGLVRKVDLERARLLDSAAAHSAPRVEPAIAGPLPARSAMPYVQSADFPRVVRADRGLEVRILGNHATPGWTFLGFELEANGERLILTPRSQAPDGIVAQVLTAFRTSARLIDLRPGRYTLEVGGLTELHGRQKIDVLPGSLLASLRTRGGFAGIDQSIEFHDQGLLRRVFARDGVAQFFELHEERMERLRQLVALLPPKSRYAKTEGAADLFMHTIGFWSGSDWITIEVDDLAATDGERELIQALRAD